ncbi:CapA family protein [Micromonospora sp. WMMA1363]|uniref:CapA family protein n=1 Tax=Micromonospora sp. WMMA1363 TaxID=3053985 RepID=UPI00259C7DFF|nr:CapA family protein [Micromonospora sp. WMMA1363]MDM4721296.1 CapA family protein [Micromonospora sp. WMMA1363]
MYSAASRKPHPPRRRLSPLVGALLGTLLAAGCGDADPGAGAVWQPGAGGSAPAASTGAAEPAATAISLSATGDIIMGNAPNRLPANDGKDFFADVEGALAADLVMGNLEEPLTVDTGVGKCGADATRCFQFRVPPEYAAHLRDAGFDLLNQANNHGHDFGAEGYQNTQAALEKYELAHTGAPGQITVVDVRGVKVAVAGFSPYSWSNPLTDIAAAAQIVTKAAGMADLVVVQVHMGAEGADRTRVKPGTEMYLGENRGDPVRFAKAMIDAGADLIVGHGPHVLRGLEFYRGRLIAYSLGNFAGGGKMLNNSGRLGWGGVLKVSLRPDGTWTSGSFASTYMNSAGLPTLDPDDRGLALVRELSGKDFPETGAVLDDSGKISPPEAG